MYLLYVSNILHSRTTDQHNNGFIWIMFTVVSPRPGPNVHIWILGSPLATGSPVSEAFLLFFLYCAMMVNTDDMNHVLLFPFQEKCVSNWAANFYVM